MSDVLMATANVCIPDLGSFKFMDVDRNPLDELPPSADVRALYGYFKEFKTWVPQAALDPAKREFVIGMLTSSYHELQRWLGHNSHEADASVLCMTVALGFEMRYVCSALVALKHAPVLSAGEQFKVDVGHYYAMWTGFLTFLAAHDQADFDAALAACSEPARWIVKTQTPHAYRAMCDIRRAMPIAVLRELLDERRICQFEGADVTVDLMGLPSQHEHALPEAMDWVSAAG